MWRLRALHQLGTIDILERGTVHRLEAARDLAQRAGALAVVADLDVQIGSVLACRDDPAPALAVTRRAADLARRLGLDGTLAVALGSTPRCATTPAP